MNLTHVTVILFVAVEKEAKTMRISLGSLLAHPGDGQQASIHVGLKEGTDF